jgi:cytochrome oxidase Cu insertion factor (SCO1/SenC/PrrC family)
MRLALAILVSLGFSTLGLAQQAGAAQQHATSQIGLAVGQRAPEFSLRDQFGHMQTNKTLKGPKGTVLLFFRSADW